jgi:hypothetical protein
VGAATVLTGKGRTTINDAQAKDREVDDGSKPDRQRPEIHQIRSRELFGLEEGRRLEVSDRRKMQSCESGDAS